MVTKPIENTLISKQVMKYENNILDIAAELANHSTVQDGPSTILEKIKDKFKLSTVGKAIEVTLNPNLKRYDYNLGGATQKIRLSFLFHGLSQRWYVDSITPQI